MGKTCHEQNLDRRDVMTKVQTQAKSTNETNITMYIETNRKYNVRWTCNRNHFAMRANCDCYLHAQNTYFSTRARLCRDGRCEWVLCTWAAHTARSHIAQVHKNVWTCVFVCVCWKCKPLCTLYFFPISRTNTTLTLASVHRFVRRHARIVAGAKQPLSVVRSRRFGARRVSFACVPVVLHTAVADRAESII